MSIKNKYSFVLFYVILFVLIINSFGLFDAVNETIYTQYFELNQRKNQSDEIVIIQIDNKSVKAIGKWPWNRSVFKELLEIIIPVKPAVIGIYLSFTEAQKDDNDKNLYDVLKSFQNIVLSTKLITYQDSKIHLNIPEKSIFPVITQGHNAFKYSDKGIVTSFPIKIQVPAFSLEVIRLYSKSRHYKLNNKLKKLFSKLKTKAHDLNNNSILIDYKRTSDKFKHISFIDVLEGKVNLEDLKNKIVLLGIVDRNLTNVLSTPYTGEKVLMSTGVELQAQIIDSLLEYRGLRELPDYLIVIISVLIAILVFWVIEKKTVIVKGVWLIISLLVFSALNIILFDYFATWFPPALAFTLILTTFSVSLYFTVSMVDKDLIKTFKKLKDSTELPLIEISQDVNTRMKTLTRLLDIINSDRNLIKAIIDGVDNGIILINKEGTVIWANGRIMSLFTDSIVLNQKIESLFNDMTFEEVLNEISNGNVFKKQIIINDNHFVCIITPIQADEKQYVGIFNDITYMVNINEMKSNILHMLSHELKTPLTNISLSVESMKSIDNPELANKYVDNIEQQNDYINILIDNFLDLSKLDAKDFYIEKQQLDLDEFMSSLISNFELIAQNKNIEIKYSGNNTPISFYADKKYLFIAFKNLLDNAIKYSPPGTIITISTELLDDNIKITFSDQGFGIDKKHINKLFNKFFRVQYNDDTYIKGTGLGLSFVKRIVELHLGKIEVISELNKGTSFIIYLPVNSQ